MNVLYITQTCSIQHSVCMAFLSILLFYLNSRKCRSNKNTAVNYKCDIKSHFSNYVQIDTCNWLNRNLNIWNVKAKTKAKITNLLKKTQKKLIKTTTTQKTVFQTNRKNSKQKNKIKIAILKRRKYRWWEGCWHKSATNICITECWIYFYMIIINHYCS